MKDSSDIFDRFMSLKALSFAFPFYNKHKEKLLYLFFGVLTTVISIAVFFLFSDILGLDVLLANIISWIIAVLFAFVTNRKWVFLSNKDDSVIKQIFLFYSGRLATLVIEEAILFGFVSLMHLPSMPIKIIAQIIVIVLNYIISKVIIFKKK